MEESDIFTYGMKSYSEDKNETTWFETEMNTSKLFFTRVLYKAIGKYFIGKLRLSRVNIVKLCCNHKD